MVSLDFIAANQFLEVPYYYIVHKNHAIKCDEYRDALKRYKLRRESENPDAVRLMIVPTVNFTNAGGGVTLLAAF